MTLVDQGSTMYLRFCCAVFAVGPFVSIVDETECLQPVAKISPTLLQQLTVGSLVVWQFDLQVVSTAAAQALHALKRASVPNRACG
jgi:hypothetical protein